MPTSTTQPKIPRSATSRGPNWSNRITGYGTIPVAEIQANAKNFRTHPDAQMRALLGVLREVGVVQNVIINKLTGFLVDGHARVALAVEDGQEFLPCTFVDLNEDEEDYILATLDPIGALARTDRKRLESVLSRLQTQDEAVQNVLTKLAKDNGLAFGSANTAADPEPRITQADELRRSYGVELGSLWGCGPHRVLCGDAADATVIDRLIGDSLISLMWTDPPYGVNYTGRTKDKLKLQSDLHQGDELYQLLTTTFSLIDKHSIDSAPFYIAYPYDGAAPIVFRDAVTQAGWRIHQTLLWVKDSIVMSRTDYHHRHEPILYGWMSGSSDPRRQPSGRSQLDKHTPNHSLWYGSDSESTVFEVARPYKSVEHPTMKPVELIQRMLRNSSQRGDIVIDPFAGSGSTLVAAHNLGRSCYCADIDPGYVAVTLDRAAQLGVPIRRLE